MKKKILIVVNVVVILGLAGGVVYLYRENNRLEKAASSSQELAKQEEEQIIASVNKLYDVPQNERPSVARVRDPEQLKKQYPDFFTNAQVDDVLLLYEKAKIAILYRPSEDKIIKVAPLSIQNEVKISVVGRKEARSATVAKLESEDITATEGTEAKGDYKTALIVDLSGSNSEQAQTIAQTLGGKVGELPKDESKPDNVDILVLVGSN